MFVNLLEGCLGGIGLFLFGMRLLSQGIRSVSSARIRAVASFATSNRLLSLITGAALALAAGSGSVALVLVIALVNGGILTSFQAVNVIAGALAGSCLALHLGFLPCSIAASPLILAGILLKLFAPRRRLASAGELLLGGGLLFFGLNLLELAVRPADGHMLYQQLSLPFLAGAVPAFTSGTLLAFLVQSSRTLLGACSSLAFQHGLSDQVAGCMAVGGLAGAALTGILASVGGSRAARRIALTFLLMALVVSLLSIAVMPHLIPPLRNLAHAMAPVDPHGSGRPLYGLLVWVFTALSLPLSGLLAVLSGVLARVAIPVDSSATAAVSQPYAGYLDARILDTPPLALEQARKEIVHMMTIVSNMYADLRDILFEYDARRADTIRQHEQVLDSLNHEITGFLAELSRTASSPSVIRSLPVLFQAVTDLEHAGDRCEDILDITVARKEEGVLFSDDAMADLKRLADQAGNAVALADSALRNPELPDKEELQSLKVSLHEMITGIREGHFERIANGTCLPRSALQFNDLTTAFEAVAELCLHVSAARLREEEP